MALVFERIQTEGIGELSYLLGDDSVGMAAVFDQPLTWPDHVDTRNPASMNPIR